MAYKRISPTPVVEGGTGAQTFTSNGVLLGNTTSAITATSAGTTGQVLAGNTGSAPTFQAASGISLGTTNHAVQVGNASGTLTSLSVGTTGQTLMGSTGANPSWTGSPSFSGSVTAGTGLTVTSGGATITAGNVSLSSGNVNIPTTTSTVGQITQASAALLHTSGVDNTFLGLNTGNFTLTGGFNTVMGRYAGNAITSGAQNVFIGWVAGQGATTASYNVGIGLSALQNLTTSGDYNTAIGFQAGISLATGSGNVLLGYQAGGSLTTNDSFNILIRNNGVAGDNNVIRIGTGGTHTKNFQAGIRGVTTANADAIAVLVDSAGQLGTVSSSIRFKENVHDLPETRILDLRPVAFNYKQDGRKSIGLIAEEVYEIMPELVVKDAQGNIESVKYHELSTYLLAEIKKLRKELDELKKR